MRRAGREIRGITKEANKKSLCEPLLPPPAPPPPPPYHIIPSSRSLSYFSEERGNETRRRERDARGKVERPSERKKEEREKNKSPTGLGCCSRRRPRCQVSFVYHSSPASLWSEGKNKNKINLAIFPVEFCTRVRDTLAIGDDVTRARDAPRELGRKISISLKTDSVKMSMIKSDTRFHRRSVSISLIFDENTYTLLLSLMSL